MGIAHQGGCILLLCSLRDGTALIVLLVACVVHRQILHARTDGYATQSASLIALPRGRFDWSMISAVGLSGPFLSPLATVLCVEWSGADVAGILNALAPAFAGLLAVLSGLESLNTLLLLGIFLGCAGGLLASRGTSSTGGGHKSGDVANAAGVFSGLVMAISQAIFLVAMKPLFKCRNGRQAIPSLVVITLAYAFAFGASLLSLLSLVLLTGIDSVIAGWGVEETMMALYAGLICSAMNFSMISWASQIVPATGCALYGALQPPFTTLFAFCWKGESLNLLGWVSMGLVGISLMLVSFQSNGEEARDVSRELLS